MEEAKEKLACQVDTARQLLHSKWQCPASSAVYQEEMLRLYSIIQAQQVSFWLYDASLLNTRELTDHKWVSEYLAFLLSQCSLRQVAIVYAHKAQVQHNSPIRDRVYRIFGRKVPIELFVTEQEALTWLFPSLNAVQLPEVQAF
ncbi:hypothetical protein [Pontibacter chitinilyticus]|uniref:hypothetical protein n=1 Tax=Pontibacter chitinilyticus TaxID=2674989 RepID=UPI00321B7519